MTPPREPRRRKLGRNLLARWFSSNPASEQSRSLRAFLLNNLSPEDRERIEDRLFEDDDFFSHLVATEQELLDARASGRLQGVEAERVEHIYGSSPVRAQRARVAQAIYQVLNAPALPPKPATLDEPIANELVAETYKQMHRAAARALKEANLDTSLAVEALMHETYVRLLRLQPARWKGRNQFLQVALVVMRRLLADFTRAQKAQARSALSPPNTATATLNAPKSDTPEELVALDHALQRLAQTNPRQSRMLELRYFAGLTEAEIATSLNVSLRAVKRDMRIANAWLHSHLNEFT